MKRAASLAESILHEYEKKLPGGVTIIPSSGGIFEVSLDGDDVFSKKALDRFPNENEVEEALGPRLGVTS